MRGRLRMSYPGLDILSTAMDILTMEYTTLTTTLTAWITHPRTVTTMDVLSIPWIRYHPSSGQGTLFSYYEKTGCWCYYGLRFFLYGPSASNSIQNNVLLLTHTKIVILKSSHYYHTVHIQVYTMRPNSKVNKHFEAMFVLIDFELFGLILSFLGLFLSFLSTSK